MICLSSVFHDVPGSSFFKISPEVDFSGSAAMFLERRRVNLGGNVGMTFLPDYDDSWTLSAGFGYTWVALFFLASQESHDQVTMMLDDRS